MASLTAAAATTATDLRPPLGSTATRETRAMTAGTVYTQPKPPKPAEPQLNPAIGELKTVDFPPAELRDQLAPEDLNDSMLMSICSALASVDNRALCPKEIAEILMYRGWTTPGSQPFAVVSTSIRTHLKRRGLGLNSFTPNGPPPLFSSWDLTTTIPMEDQPCMGIEPQAKPAVKRGTLWYLSQAAGYESPFGDRHPDSLFNPVPIKKAAPAPRPAAPKPKARSSEQVSPVSTPAPVSTPVPLTHLPSSVDPAQALAELEGNLELGRGKRKRKLASDVATTDQPSKVAAVSVSSATTMTSQPPSIHEQSPSSAECNGSSGLRRLKVKLTAPAPAPCPVFSQPIDGDDEEEKITSSDVDMSESDEEHLSSSMICRETLASERRRFRKRSRSEGHMLLSVPLDSDEPRTATLSDHHCSAPDYLGYSTSMSSSAPALDSWALLSRTTPGPFEQEECKADHQDDPQVATRRDPSADLADGEESEVAPDTLFDECEDNTSTAATTPRSPLQVKQEPFDMDESFIFVHRDAPSPMPDLPSLPIVTQAEQDVRQAPHQQQTVEETPFHFAMMHAGAFNRLFAQPRHRSLSPDESLYTFAQGSPSASVSRGASPGNLTLSDCAPSPLPSDDDDLIGMEEDEQPEDEHIARESLSPVVDISELDLGASWSKLSRHTKDSLDGRDPTKPFGPEVFGTLGAEACAPWHPPARLINSEVFDMTVIPASDDFVELEERESSCEPVDFGKSSSPEPEMEASHSVESDKSPPPSRPRASARRRSTNASLATVMAAAAPSKLPTRRTSRSSIASEPSPPRSTRSSGRSANKQQQQQPSPPEPRHTRSASSATTKAQELPPPSRSTRSSSKR